MALKTEIARARTRTHGIDALERSLVRSLGRENVSRTRRTIEHHSFDALRLNRGFSLPSRGFPPDIVVSPTTTEHVVKLVNLARERRLPLVPWGGGTGLMGGAEAIDGGIIVDFRKMRRILRFDREDRLIEVEAGATMGMVNRYLSRRGFLLGHDPWTRDFATIGGAISTNGMGYLGTKFGPMGDQVLGLQVVLGDGEVLETRPSYAKSGFDLNRLFIGTEGTLGVITRATLKCQPRPSKELHLAFSFVEFERALEATMAIADMDVTALDLVSEGADGPCKLHVTITGDRAEVSHVARKCGRASRSSRGRRLSHREAQKYWDDRHRVAEEYAKVVSESPFAIWRGAKAFDYLHVAVPLRSMLKFWRKARRIVSELGLTVESYGLYCHPSLFSLTLTRERGVPQDNLEVGVNRIVEEAILIGGYFEFVHGIGIRYRRMLQMQDRVGRGVVRRIKECLDGEGTLNPGKLGL
jgi:FAD/FMN-containing dehydrogenase